MTPQKLNLELIKLASFNNFDGKIVAMDLEKNRHLWKGAVLTRLDDLIYLRDLPDKIWNVDTLFITSKAGHEDELEKLAATWCADELDWCSEEETQKLLGTYCPEFRRPKKLLRVWWD